MKTKILLTMMGAVIGVCGLLAAGFRRTETELPAIDSILKDRALVSCGDCTVLLELLEVPQVGVARERLSVRLRSEILTLENVSQRTPLNAQELRVIERGRNALSPQSAANASQK